jgi:membrane peptidoglycan carboxypeptidase
MAETAPQPRLRVVPSTPVKRRIPFGRILTGVALVMTVAVAATFAAAWFAGPRAGDIAGQVRQRLQVHHAKPVQLAGIAPVMRQAVVATEDERFYRHHGVDLVGVIRAVGYDASHLTLAQGASTVTEQLVKLLYLHGNDASVWRKLKDAAGALRVESVYSKQEILQAYLNAVYYGHRAYGIGSAAERYFGVRAGRLNLAQASLLAGLIQAPSAYDPFVHPQAARQRQVSVLRSMVRNGFVAPAEGQEVLTAPLKLRGGKALPPLRGIDLSPGPEFSGRLLWVAVAMVMLAVVLAVVGRRRKFRWWPAVFVVVLVAGLFVLARSLQVL